MCYFKGSFLNICGRYQHHLVASTGTLTVHAQTISKDSQLFAALTWEYGLIDVIFRYVPEKEPEKCVTSKYGGNIYCYMFIVK